MSGDTFSNKYRSVPVFLEFSDAWLATVTANLLLKTVFPAPQCTQDETFITPDNQIEALF